MASEAKRAANRARKVRGKKIIADAKDKPCADCGGKFPGCVMDLDHRPGEIKSFEVATQGYYQGVAALNAEIAKCDVVCANCHRIRTRDRGYFNSPTA